MLVNNIKIAWRNLLKNKTFSIINVTGLALAMAASMLIAIWVYDEFACDKGHENKHRIYEVYNRYKRNDKVDCWNVTPMPMAKAMQAEFGEIDKMCRVYWPTEALFSYQDKKLKANYNIVDSTFLEVFTFPLVKGHKRTQFKNPNAALITEKLAKSLFGDEDAIDRVIFIDQEPYTISGVLKEYSDKSRFQFDCLLPYAVMRAKGYENDNWSNNSIMTYAMLRENVELEKLQQKILPLRKKYDKDGVDIETFLYPMSRARLYGRFENGKEVGDRIVIVKMLSITSLLILLIACINFMNLSTARSDKRAKEVGIRKAAGASRSSIAFQFLLESILTSFIALSLAYLLVRMSFPYFNDLAGKNLNFNYHGWKVLLGCVAFTLFTGILAGSYPSWYLSKFDAVTTLKGAITPPKTLITPRKILILIQFVFSTFLIISTIIINKELKYVQERDTGYEKKELVYHFLEGDMEKNYDLIKNELIQQGIAISITKTSAPITEGWSNSDGMVWKGKEPSQKTIVDRYCADANPVTTLGLKLLAGRDIDLKTFKTDSTSMIINTSMARLMGHKNAHDALGKTVFDNGIEWKVVGVIEDIILHSPFGQTQPMVIEGAKGWFNIMHVKYTTYKPMNENLIRAEKIFAKYNPAYPFNFNFVDEAYAKKFDDAEKIAKMSSFFAGFSIFISCLGMFGLISFIAASRRKEIAIRKVNGASLNNLLTILSIDFVKIIAMAFVVAIPLAWYLMDKWLSQYRYQIEITWSVFAFAAMILILITLVTIGYQTVKAAMANPALSLRSE